MISSSCPNWRSLSKTFPTLY
ncbi:hypothetical protein ACFL37_01700 [Candidatus Margulisiibacteriota bacterium]